MVRLGDEVSVYDVSPSLVKDNPGLTFRNKCLLLQASSFDNKLYDHIRMILRI